MTNAEWKESWDKADAAYRKAERAERSAELAALTAAEVIAERTDEEEARDPEWTRTLMARLRSRVESLKVARAAAQAACDAYPTMPVAERAS